MLGIESPGTLEKRKKSKRSERTNQKHKRVDEGLNCVRACVCVCAGPSNAEQRDTAIWMARRCKRMKRMVDEVGDLDEALATNACFRHSATERPSLS